MLKVLEVAFTGYPVTDLKRAREFYEGVLNLQVAREFGEDTGKWIEYDIGPATLAITNMAPEWKPSSCGPSIALEVEDFDAAIAALRAAKATFMIEPMNSGMCHLAVVLDPDGNSVAIHKRQAHAAA
jgi:predicted enzyme related to lactoylglutathione lyase